MQKLPIFKYFTRPSQLKDSLSSLVLSVFLLVVGAVKSSDVTVMLSTQVNLVMSLSVITRVNSVSHSSDSTALFFFFFFFFFFIFSLSFFYIFLLLIFFLLLILILFFFFLVYQLHTKTHAHELYRESAVRMSEDPARSSDNRISPRSFGGLRPLSPRKCGNTHSHTHTQF